MKKSVLTILAPGFEEIEAITPIDILRRANVEVTIASLESEQLVCGRSNIFLQADIKLDAVLERDFDALILPGGPGAKRLRKDERVLKLVNELYIKNRLIGAICAAPTVLWDAGILEGKNYTAHFSTKEELKNIQGNKAVVIDGNIITSRGAGTALSFALAIIEILVSKEVADNIERDICYR